MSPEEIAAATAADLQTCKALGAILITILVWLVWDMSRLTAASLLAAAIYLVLRA